MSRKADRPWESLPMGRPSHTPSHAFPRLPTPSHAFPFLLPMIATGLPGPSHSDFKPQGGTAGEQHGKTREGLWQTCRKPGISEPKGGPHETGMGRPGKDLRKLARSLADPRKAYYLQDSARDCTFRASARAWQTPGRFPGRRPEAWQRSGRCHLLRGIY